MELAREGSGDLPAAATGDGGCNDDRTGGVGANMDSAHVSSPTKENHDDVSETALSTLAQLSFQIKYADK